MPDGWRFDGRLYYTAGEIYSAQHPGMSKLVEMFLEQENAKIGEYNRELLKKSEAEAKLYD